ncbi:MAG: hypothetical protein RR444_10625 [Oscillospiraceae bacterium]
MKKNKILSFVLCLTFISMLFSTTAMASDIPIEIPPLSQAVYNVEINDEIGLAFFNINTDIQPYGYTSKTGTSTGYFYLKSDNSVLGNIKTTGTFSYVTAATASVSNVADGWRITKNESTEQISPTYACAIGEFSLYSVGFMGIETLSSTAVAKVYCNQKGTITPEFNSD